MEETSSETFLMPRPRECLRCQSQCFPYHIYDRGSAYLVYWSCSNDDCRKTFTTYESRYVFLKVTEQELDDYADQAGIQGLEFLIEESEVSEEFQ